MYPGVLRIDKNHPNRGGKTMPIVRWDPFKNVAALQERINRLFEDSFPSATQEDELALCNWRPTVDIYETEQGIVIKVDLPGVKKEDVSVEIKENLLTLKGERKEETEIREENYLRKERCCGSFHRAFSLQYPIAPDMIKARFKDGVLMVEIPKPEDEKPKQIQVSID
jgi:HSP20 family protein